MDLPESRVFFGKPYVSGVASAKLLAANLELSFWDGVDPKTGEIIDRFHPLSGRYLKDTILAIPGGRGSCGGSVVMMELILNGLGPKALVFARCEEIITLGVIVADELFGQRVPVVTLSSEDFRQVLRWDRDMVHISRSQVSNAPIKGFTNSATNFVDSGMTDEHIQLSSFDQAILDGVNGEASRVSMKIIVRMAHIMGAQELMDVSQAHVDGAWYGPGSLAFGEKLRDWGGIFKVPTTINSLNVDQKRWRALGVDAEVGMSCDRLTKAFLDMKGKASFTCAPYLLETAPKLGEAVAWGESNAVIYANSVLGARTLKNPNMLECLIALTGRAPKSGVYLDDGRLATVCIQVPLIKDNDDSFWPILGYCIGAVAANRIPAITGVADLKPTKDDFKAFSAAFATSSSAPMFHMIGLTQEAPTLESIQSKDVALEGIELSMDSLMSCWNEFNHGTSARQVDIISLGNPHFSFQEIKRLVFLCRGRTKHKDVRIVVTCGRAQYGLAAQAGHVEEAESFGVQFLTDTCWCSIEEPIIPQHARVIMTNSGKYVHYGPGLTGRNFCFGSLEMCVKAACSGWTTGKPPVWLQAAEINRTWYEVVE